MADLNDPLATKMGNRIWQRKGKEAGTNLGLDLEQISEELGVSPAELVDVLREMESANLIRVEKAYDDYAKVTIRVKAEWVQGRGGAWRNGQAMQWECGMGS